MGLEGKNIQMVDLVSQYQKIQSEIDNAVLAVIRSAAYINGPAVKSFQQNLANFLAAKFVIPCANGTDALQIALMAAGLQPGDEVILPSFTYVSTAEVIALLRLKPVMVDVDENTFNITADIIEAAITDKTKAVVPVNLYGQSCDYAPIMALAEKHQLTVIEDNAQALGATYTFPNGTKQKTGTIGHIGCTSFYPSKNLGAYGDGGAIYTNNEDLADRLKMIANHGQKRRYYHDIIGVNSRLDSIQAAILDIKLKYLDEYAAARNKVADFYDQQLGEIQGITIPARTSYSDHVFHQYTIKVQNGQRDALQSYLKENGIPSVIYYPVPLQKQEAYKTYWDSGKTLPVTEKLCREVLSLPIHTEMNEEILSYTTAHIQQFMK